jgi:hypothetical protein
MSATDVFRLAPQRLGPKRPAFPHFCHFTALLAYRWVGRSAPTTFALLRTPSCDTYANPNPADLRGRAEGLRTPTATPRASATFDTHVRGEPRFHLTSTTPSSSRRYGISRWHSVSESTASSLYYAGFDSLPKVSGSQHKRDTTWASTSTQRPVITSHMLQNFRGSPSKPVN